MPMHTMRLISIIIKTSLDIGLYGDSFQMRRINTMAVRATSVLHVVDGKSLRDGTNHQLISEAMDTNPSTPKIKISISSAL